ncbi:P-loop containing nucleoside triphosphate hydrolase protein [Glonium stellatum]|uniref:P-loop containing nucleoside triphosphate hydrolase protein n=1 Tax=Glonium stellatum TaxID=574774 RepID=A0A8E2JWL5_9PEZI|nr:P-loop containing nucleoside triphosphate hydrolase protein [Glonium stellatum]
MSASTNKLDSTAVNVDESFTVQDKECQPENTPPQGPKIVFILGAPASGKGSISQCLLRDFDFDHISVGDYLRHLTKTTPAAHETMQPYLKSADLVPWRYLGPYLTDRIRSAARTYNRVLVDGFPRSVDQKYEFDRAIKDTPSLGKIELVIRFKCPKEELRRRYLARKRGDDNAELFEKRYSEFEQNIGEILSSFDGSVHIIESDTSKAPKEAYEELRDKLSKQERWLQIVGLSSE